MVRTALFLGAAAVCTAACSSPPPAGGIVRTWGTMREVLREGHDEGRVALAGLATPAAVGVGALAGLAGEVTVVDGRALVSVADGAECRVADAAPGQQAALLVLAEVPRWRERALPECATYADLEAAIEAALRDLGLDPAGPVPLRVRGRAPLVEFHVIAGACPIANPTGPPPWRFAGALERAELVGVYAAGAAGRLTHHHRSSHLHVVAEGRMGHLDEVSLTGATLLLPVR